MKFEFEEGELIIYPHEEFRYIDGEKRMVCTIHHYGLEREDNLVVHVDRE